MKHPSIDPSFQEGPSFEQQFAGQMLTLLAAYHNPTRENQGEYHVKYPITDRADIKGGEDYISGALRLRRVRSMAVVSSDTTTELEAGATVTLAQPAEDEHTVLALEYGEPYKLSHETVLDDSEFNWSAYVLAVASYESGETVLLDGQTGRELSGADLAEASYRLGFLASHLSFVAYECFVEGEDDTLDITAAPLPIGKNRTIQNMFHDSFDHEAVQAELYELHECGAHCNLDDNHPKSLSN